MRVPFFSQVLLFTEIELRKFRHDWIELVIRGVQPALWITVFGSVFRNIRGIHTPKGVDYMAFMTPGVIAQSVLFISIFTGVAVLWERELGQLGRQLAAPVSRTAMALGRTCGTGIKGLLQALTVLALALALRVSIVWHPLYLISVFVIVFGFATAFSSLATFLALTLKTRERVMATAQMVVMPLFFASNAIYPVELMPRWLQIISAVNPLSHVVSALRALLVTEDLSTLPMDITLTFAWVVALNLLSALAFRRLEE